MDTIFALSSGMPPAGIAVVRISGPQAGEVLRSLSGSLPEPRKARLATLRDGAGQVLDRALILWFPGPNTVTREDLAELHLHGGRAVVTAVENALAALEGMRRAQPGEFTRRAFANGKMDLAEAEGLADLLSAETELQRQAAMEMAGGALSRQVEQWRGDVLAISAQVEAALDFMDEEDVALAPDRVGAAVDILAHQIEQALAAPAAETLREGFRVALAGPPNAGKSTLFNALVENESAITSPQAGTTRDVLTQLVAMAGIPFTYVDMAGLRDATGDLIEAEGISRAQAEIARADLVLWLGPEGAGPPGSWEIEAQIDRPEGLRKCNATHRLSAVSGAGLAELRLALVDCARAALPKPGRAALNRRQRALLLDASEELTRTRGTADLLLVAEQLRRVRLAFDQLTGRSSTEDVLDALFGRFCIGK